MLQARSGIHVSELERRSSVLVSSYVHMLIIHKASLLLDTNEPVSCCFVCIVCASVPQCMKGGEERAVKNKRNNPNCAYCKQGWSMEAWKGREEQPRTRHVTMRASMLCFFFMAHMEENGAIGGSVFCGVCGYETKKQGARRQRGGKRARREAKGGISTSSRLFPSFFTPFPTLLSILICGCSIHSIHFTLTGE